VKAEEPDGSNAKRCLRRAASRQPGQDSQMVLSSQPTLIPGLPVKRSGRHHSIYRRQNTR
jgi:hypothetical protein